VIKYICRLEFCPFPYPCPVRSRKFDDVLREADLQGAAADDVFASEMMLIF
jgi:hypothetical protein